MRSTWILSYLCLRPKLRLRHMFNVLDLKDNKLEIPMEKLVKHTGGCHCGAVKFEVSAPAVLTAFNCRTPRRVADPLPSFALATYVLYDTVITPLCCSICTKKQCIHFIVPTKRFKILKGENCLTTYTFGTHVAKHKFCKICGVQSFYQPRSNPDGVAVMPHCLAPGTVQQLIIVDFDGENWDKTIAKNPEGILSMSKENP